MMKKRRSFEIALSSIAAAIGAGALMLGSVSPFLLAAGYLIACFSIMIPLSKDFLWGALLCYLAEGLLAVFLNPFKIVPYFVFFGLHPIVNFLQKKYIKKTPFKVCVLLLKTAWFDLSMWLSYYILKTFAGFVFPEYIETFFFYLLFLGGSVFFVFYDVLIFFCQASANLIIRRIRR